MSDAELRLVLRAIADEAPFKATRQQMAALAEQAKATGKAAPDLEKLAQAYLKSGQNAEQSAQSIKRLYQAISDRKAVRDLTAAQVEAGAPARIALSNAQQIVRTQGAASAGGGRVLGALGLTGEGPARTIAAFVGVGLGLNVAATAASRLHDAIAEDIAIGINFEKEMSDIRAVSGATAQQMEDLSTQARSVGRAFGVGPIETAKGINTLIKAGISVQDALGGATEATITLARAGGVDLPASAEIAATALNTFGLAASALPRVADLVAGAANVSAIEVDDVRQALAQAGAVARTAGLSFDDTAKSLGVLGAQGLKGSDAGTSLRTLLLRLTPESVAAADAMQRLGIITADGGNKFFDAAGKAKSMADIAQVLQDATRNLSEQQRILALQTAFGTDAIRAAAILAREGAAGFNSLAAEMEKVKAADIAKVRLDNLAGDLQKAGASWDALAASIGSSQRAGFRIPVQLVISVLNAATDATADTRTAEQKARDEVEKHFKAVSLTFGLGEPIVVDMRSGEQLTPAQAAERMATELRDKLNEAAVQVAARTMAELTPTAVLSAPIHLDTAVEREANQRLVDADRDVKAKSLALAQAQKDVTAAQLDVQQQNTEAQIRALPYQQKINELKLFGLLKDQELIAPRQRLREIDREIANARQQDIALIQREADLQVQLLEPKRQQRELERQIADQVDRRGDLEREQQRLTLEVAATGPQRALEDTNDAVQRLVLQAGARQISKSEARRRIRALQKQLPAEELAAFDAQQSLKGVTRQEQDARREGRLRQIPYELQKLAVDDTVAAIQRQMDAVHDAQAAEEARAQKVAAGYEGERRQIQQTIDKINDQKQALDDAISKFNTEQQLAESAYQGEKSRAQERLLNAQQLAEQTERARDAAEKWHQWLSTTPPAQQQAVIDSTSDRNVSQQGQFAGPDAAAVVAGQAPPRPSTYNFMPNAVVTVRTQADIDDLQRRWRADMERYFAGRTEGSVPPTTPGAFPSP